MACLRGHSGSEAAGWGGTEFRKGCGCEGKPGFKQGDHPFGILRVPVAITWKTGW